VSYCSHPSVGVGVTTYVKVFLIVQIFSKSIDIWLWNFAHLFTIMTPTCKQEEVTVSSIFLLSSTKNSRALLSYRQLLFIFILTYIFFQYFFHRAIEQTSTYNGSSSKVSIEQAISVNMTNENSAYIHFFTVNFSGSQGKIRRPSAKKKPLRFYYSDI
jgi:hypothetical protein